jgi:hypothetical protein
MFSGGTHENLLFSGPAGTALLPLGFGTVDGPKHRPFAVISQAKNVLNAKISRPSLLFPDPMFREFSAVD